MKRINNFKFCLCQPRLMNFVGLSTTSCIMLSAPPALTILGRPFRFVFHAWASWSPRETSSSSLASSSAPWTSAWQLLGASRGSRGRGKLRNKTRRERKRTRAELRGRTCPRQSTLGYRFGSSHLSLPYAMPVSQHQLQEDKLEQRKEGDQQLIHKRMKKEEDGEDLYCGTGLLPRSPPA